MDRKNSFLKNSFGTRQKLVIAHLAIVGIERPDRIGGRVEHLLGHRDRIGKLFEIEQREFLGRRHRDDLVVQIAEEVFDRLKLSFDELYAPLDLVERSDAPFEDLDVRLLDAFGLFVGRSFRPRERPAKADCERPAG